MQCEQRAVIVVALHAVAGPTVVQHLRAQWRRVDHGRVEMRNMAEASVRVYGYEAACTDDLADRAQDSAVVDGFTVSTACTISCVCVEDAVASRQQCRRCQGPTVEVIAASLARARSSIDNTVGLMLDPLANC